MNYINNEIIDKYSTYYIYIYRNDIYMYIYNYRIQMVSRNIMNLIGMKEDHLEMNLYCLIG